MACRIKNRSIATKWMGVYVSLKNPHNVYHSKGTFSLTTFRIN